MNQKYIGSKILSELNDLKRTVKSASEELALIYQYLMMQLMVNYLKMNYENL